jgi:hypothetical protein
MSSRLVLALSLLCAFSAVRADTVPAAATPPAPGERCKQPEFHQFDFWIGEWDVTEKDQPAGHSRIDAILLNCAISENWSSAQGGDGKSYNAYDAQSKQWTQFWVAQSGTTLLLRGGLQG